MINTEVMLNRNLEMLEDVILSKENTLIRPSGCLTETEERAQVLNRFMIVNQEWLDKAQPFFKTHKLLDTHKRFVDNWTALYRDVQDRSIPLNITLQRADLLLAEIISNPLFVAYLEKDKLKKKATEEANFMVKTVSEFLYLLQTSGKVMVLCDNLKRAELEGTKHHGDAYSLLSYHDAQIKYANAPCEVMNSKGDYERVNVVKAWNESPLRKDLDGITFDPSTTDRIVNGKYNIWRGWTVEPKEGDTSAFIELVHEILCDGNAEYSDFVLKWLAHMIQKPHERPLCAIGVSGPQGYGKSTLMELVGSLMHASHFNRDVKMEMIAGERQGRDLEGILLAYIDEASWGGNMNSNGAIKKAITGRADLINEKFVPTYSVPTYKRCFFSSNEEYYYHADPDDRRLLPLRIDGNKPKRSQEFFDRLYLPGGDPRPELLSAILHMLQNINIEGWVPHKELQSLKIVAGGAMLERSMTNVQRWLKHSINERAFECLPITPGEAPEQITCDMVSIDDLRRSYAFYCSHSALDKNRTVNLASAEATEFIRKVFGAAAKPIKRAGRVQRGYLIDWNSMRENFQSAFKWTIQWDNNFPPAHEEVVDSIETAINNVRRIHA